MQQISFYLKKFETLEIKDSGLIKIIISVVSDLVKVDLDKKDIVIKNGQITIKKTGPEKTEIFINRLRIEKEIKSRLNSEKRDLKIK